MLISNNGYFNISPKNTNIYVRLTQKGQELLKETLTEGNESFSMPQEDEYGYSQISTKNLFDTFRFLVTQEFSISVSDIINPVILINVDNKTYEYDLYESTICFNFNRKISVVGQTTAEKNDDNRYDDGLSFSSLNDLFTAYGFLLYKNSNADITDLISGDIVSYTVYLKEKFVNKKKEF